jgi:hypothetical protein
MKPVSHTYRPVVVVPAFRRPEALKNLLQSLNRAIYPQEGCTLIVSLEGEVEENVSRVAENFDFDHGEKKIIHNTQKLGLKSHIYKCADYSKKFGSVILLEEDLIVSPAYYLYAVQALQAYENESQVAGISLYAQRFNETAQLPFEPMSTYYAGYFLKLACSWGQAWTMEQWKAFQKWIEEYPVPKQLDDVRIPENIRKWPASSWKREFNYYLTQTGRTIFYPYQSLATNSSHYGGQNMQGTGSLFEVPIVENSIGIDSIIFPDYEKALISYDMYMEANGEYVKEATGYSQKELILDLYGMKPISYFHQYKWTVTSKEVNRSQKGYALKRKPVEFNLRYPSEKDPDTFFSLARLEDVNMMKENRWAFIRLATHLGSNRLSTGRLVKDNLYFKLLNLMKS